MSKRTPEEILKAIEDSETDEASEVEAEMERVLAMSSEERRRELEAAGVDLHKLDAQVDALYEKIRAVPREEPAEGGAWVTGAPPAPPKSIGPRWAVLLAAALATAIVGPGIPYALGLLKHDDKPTQNEPDASPTPSPNVSPQAMRARAFDACDHQQWQECVDLLSAARKMDPAGDADEHVQAAWRTALAALRPRDPDRKQRPTP